MTALIRTALKDAYARARDAHAGLLIQRGYPEYEEGSELKTAHIKRICAIPASDFYTAAYNRWSTLVRGDTQRFRVLELPLESRLFIGLTSGGMLETGCAIHHSYGVPYIMGSSVKGGVNAYVRGTDFGKAHPEVCDELFGSAPSDDHRDGLAGLFTFHDAWWVPGSAETPMVQEVVTTHHLAYYGKEGEVPASDLDSPIPNAQIAVRGSFLFVIEGPAAWMHLAEEMCQGWFGLGQEMLTSALTQSGLGAKRRAGYGYFVAGGGGSGGGGGGGTRCPWVDETVQALMQKNRSKEDDTLRGKGLAEAWQALDDPEVKAAALADIRSRLQAMGQWDAPQGKSAKQAKQIYEPPEGGG